ncbi:MAG: N-acetylmuramoyl-L-alanine amidase [Candidatus Paceibacterota bacterium]|jgi:N-acetylmuramoyl-L-alanine amidase
MRNGLFWIITGVGSVSLAILFSAVGGIQPIRETIAWITKETQTAAVFFVPSITVAQIQNDYRGVQISDSIAGARSAPASGKRVRILIVPGHEPDAGGAEFGNLKERTIVVDIANALAALLSQNPHYEVMVSRTKTAWNPILQDYFDTHVLEIDVFQKSLALQMQKYLADGSILPEVDQVYHNTVSSKTGLQLYGINKWTSDNRYDITLHLHINDEAGRRAGVVGKYDGFAIYVPNHQYSNAEASTAIGEALARRLNAYHATSTLPKENVGVVPDQELIAIGSNNSADGAALLIEYGYISEPQFRDSSVRSVAVTDYALQTYLGLQDFFKDTAPSTYGSISFPYDWTKVTGKSGERGPGIYALQSALHYLGYYPSVGKSFSECPVSGVAGACTHSAIMEYQSARGLEITGTLGPRTRATLNQDLKIHS